MSAASGVEARVALVTGGGRGIGRGIALALADAGADVAVSWHTRREAAEATVATIRARGRGGVAVPLRLEEPASVERAVQATRDALGPVTVLVNNAALAQEKPFETLGAEDWAHMLAVNLTGPALCCRTALGDMLERGWGRIVNVTSIGGQWGGMNQVHYACAKAGLIGLTRSLARLYSGCGITTNAVAPGLVATEMSSRELASETGRAKVAGIPAGRIGSVEEVARAVAFLASDAAGYVTGQTLNLNGGMYFG